MSLDPRIIKESFSRIESVGEVATAYFYGRLFAENPRLRAMFPPAMDAQRDRLFQSLTKIVWSLDSPDALASYLGQLGRDHRKFGVRPEHFAAVGAALIATLRKFNADSWTTEVEQAWTTAFTVAAGLMMDAGEAAAAKGPPWWVAEVVDHERRTHDIAVVTVRPGQQYPFTAGQYVTVQTSRWPRVWRPYSVANAPRSDGTLRLHVRALPAGWVSGALVRHTKVGDSVMLGPPLGTMTLDPDSDRDLLLVAGGTGLAPLKALIEQVIMSGRHRNIHLVVGARTERDLYDLPDLQLLESTYPWLRVIPVVSDEPAFNGMRGRVADVLDRFQDWDGHEVYVAGPSEMIACTIHALHETGLSAASIHHDALDLTAAAFAARPVASLGFIPP